MKIVIPGTFWDSQIYYGKLYLFGIDGSIQTIKWNKLIEEWKIDQNLELALKCAFSESDFLYGHDQQIITNDPEIKLIIKNKFERLADVSLELNAKYLKKYQAGHQDSPFPFPHTDSFILKKNFFIASKSGIHQANCEGKTSKPISKLVKKHTDCPTLNISLKFSTIAFAAGEEGLFELYFGESGIRDKAKEPRLLTKGNFGSCDWLFWSIYGTSYTSSSKLVDFKISDERKKKYWLFDNDLDDEDEDKDSSTLDEVPTRSGISKRKLSKVITEKTIFKDQGISWGNQDKICMVKGNTLHIVKYNPQAEENSKRLITLRTVELYAWKGEVISGAITHFGVIVECENALVIVPTDGDPITLPGECVSWRVFPRSINYVNQLHVIYGDRIEIHSFNHDYFVDQTEKHFGIWHHTGGSGRQNSRLKKPVQI